MTGFAGAFAKVPEACEEANNVCKVLGARLSRHSEDNIYQVHTGRAFVCHFDIGAWSDGPSFRGTDTSGMCGDTQPNASFLKTCGDPVLDGVANRQVAFDTFAQSNIEDLASLLRRCRGTFSLVKCSGEHLVLATDKFASRPVYWLETECCVVFSTNYRSLVRCFYASLDIDETALSEKICLGQPLDYRTVFRQIRILPPGMMLRCVRSQILTEVYHSWAEVPRIFPSYDEALEELYQRFLDSVRLRCVVDEQPLSFLSGGLDSRAVVAALLDMGYPVKTFNSSYEQSADHVLGEMIAKKFGTEHITDFRSPEDRLRTEMDPFARYARRAFIGDDASAARMWTGDGGSVGLGFVYVTNEAIDAALRTPVSKNCVRKLFPRLDKNGFRCVPASRKKEFRERAAESLCAVLNKIETSDEQKRIYLFYLQNDQMRHLHDHFEDIDISRIEFVTPFFDSDFISYILQLPIDWLLHHAFYNDWIRQFRTPADAVPWQSYPGHTACPLPLPEGIMMQWEAAWYSGPGARRVYVDVARQVLGRQGRHSSRVISGRRLNVFKISLQSGSHRFAHEVNIARKLTDALEP